MSMAMVHARKTVRPGAVAISYAPRQTLTSEKYPCGTICGADRRDTGRGSKPRSSSARSDTTWHHTRTYNVLCGRVRYAIRAVLEEIVHTACCWPQFSVVRGFE